MTPRYVEWRESKTVKQECHVRKHLQYLLASVSVRVNTTKNIRYTLVIIFQAFWKLLLLAMIYHFGDINTIRHGMIFWQNICRKSKYWPNRWMDFIVIEVKQSGNQIWVGSSILPKNEQNSLSWVEKILRIVSFVRFFERIEDTINTFEIYWSFSQSLKILNLFVSLMLIA